MIKFPSGVVRLSPNISFMKNYPMRAKLESLFKRPTFVENDVNAGLYGEQQFGAAQGASDIVGIFPGTGVGGALILNGELYRGAFGAAGEIGHMFLSLESLIHKSRLHGTLEAYVGRTAIAAEAAVLAMKQKAPHLYEVTGTDLKKIKSKALQRSLHAPDKAVVELLAYKAKLIGLSMASLANILNPELFVLGGGLIEAMGNFILPIARDTMMHYGMPPNVDRVRVKASQLKDFAVVKGAAKLGYDSAVLRGEIS
jgi:glucokinase